MRGGGIVLIPLEGFRHPLFLVIAFWDGLAVFLMIFFATRARAEKLAAAQAA